MYVIDGIPPLSSDIRCTTKRWQPCCVTKYSDKLEAVICIPGHKLRPYPGMEMDFVLRLKRTLLCRSATLPLSTIQWYGGVALLRFCLRSLWVWQHTFEHTLEIWNSVPTYECYDLVANESTYTSVVSYLDLLPPSTADSSDAACVLPFLMQSQLK